VVALAVGLAVAVGCVRLGIWQLSRLAQRRARNAAALAARQRPAVDLVGSSGGDSILNRRVHVRGIYDFAREQAWRPRIREDEPGVDLVTPLRLIDGGAVLVDRGWAPSADAYHVDARLFRERDSADVVGLALPAPRGHGDVDPRALRDSFPYPLLPFVVQELPLEGGGSPPGAPVRWPAPELSNGPHLSYAIQWFSFAAIAVVGSLALVRKRGLPRTQARG